jgi:hypothetical protein
MLFVSICMHVSVPAALQTAQHKLDHAQCEPKNTPIHTQTESERARERERETQTDRHPRTHTHTHTHTEKHTHTQRNHPRCREWSTKETTRALRSSDWKA